MNEYTQNCTTVYIAHIFSYVGPEWYLLAQRSTIHPTALPARNSHVTGWSFCAIERHGVKVAPKLHDTIDP
jgi:hypothetical protein